MSRPPLACGVALIRNAPSGLARRTSSVGAPSASKSSSGRYERIHSSSSRRWSGSSFTPDSGTWCARQVPWICTPSTTSGPVQPLGVRRTISGHRGRLPSQSPPRAAAWMARMSAHACARAAANRWCIPGRSSPSTSITSYPWPSSRDRTSAGSLRPSTVGPAIFAPLRCRIGSTAPSRSGLRNDTPFHDPSSGPVSASPSPTMASASRSGLSITAPNAWVRT